jgi:hypothetical protein
MLPHLFYGVVLASAPIAVIYLVLLNRVIAILRDSHRDIYVRMGEPSLIQNNNASNGLRLLWFLLLGKYGTLADRKLSALGRACRVLIIVCFCIYVYCFLTLTFH